MISGQVDSEVGVSLVRLGLFRPFIRELERRRVNYDAIFENCNISPDAVRDDSSFVPAPVMYRLVEDAAHVAQDPFLGVIVGESLNFAAWSPFIDAVTYSRCLADFLLRFVISAKSDASSVKYSLESSETIATFRQRRTHRPRFRPRQVDGFTMAYTLKLISLARGEQWNPGEVSISVCSTEVIPSGYRKVQVTQGDRMGVAVQFPAEWLLNELDRALFAETIRADKPSAQFPSSFLDTLRSTLKMNFSLCDTNVDAVARLYGMSRQSLQRKLRSEGTTFSAEIAAIRLERASDLLRSSSNPISDIALSTGFDSAANFSRAFKSWTGQSPMTFRKASKATAANRQT